MKESCLHFPRVVALLGSVALCLALFSGCGQTPQPSSPEAPGNATTTATNPSNKERHDLSRDEEHGGHTLARHVGRSDEELRDRLQRERDISAASTWTNRQIAEETVAAALRTEQRRIEQWEQRSFPRANLALHFDAGRSVGRSLRRGETQTTPCTNAVIVLKADGTESFYVLTTYPEARE